MVSGLTEFGLFVELADPPVEGMIRVEDLGPDWYEYDARRQTLRAVRGGGLWKLGQTVDARLLEVLPGRLEIRLAPAGAEEEGGGRRRIGRLAARREKRGTVRVSRRGRRGGRRR